MEEMVEVAAKLQSEGIDAIELSGGAHHSEKNMPLRVGTLELPEDEVYYRNEALRYKEIIRHRKIVLAINCNRCTSGLGGSC